MIEVSSPCAEVFESLKDFYVRIYLRRGRISEIIYVEYYLMHLGEEKKLFVASFFSGRPPLYKKWIEIFSISPEIRFGKKVYRYIGSPQEEAYLKCISSLLGPGESLFIEYVSDKETLKSLDLGVPPHLTRLGYLLLKNGFTWLKNWYFPEGFMEGGPKLQGEKPINEETRSRHLREICVSTRRFIDLLNINDTEDHYKELFHRVLVRAREILDMCREHFSQEDQDFARSFVSKES